jgi:hypothetical protein
LKSKRKPDFVFDETEKRLQHAIKAHISNVHTRFECELILMIVLQLRRFGDKLLAVWRFSREEHSRDLARAEMLSYEGCSPPLK